MTKTTLSSLALACALTLGAGGQASAQSGGSHALLDALVRKKVLSSEEADEIRADLVKEQKASSADKIKLSSSLTELKLYGDLRLRYQYDNRNTQLHRPQNTTIGANGEGDPRHGRQRGRARFRLRLGADFKLTDNFFGGVQLQTASASDSGNQTFTGGFSNYDIFISRAYLGWNAFEGITLIGGKQRNPFYSTDLVWDGDINPTGVVEKVEFHKLVALGAEEDASLPWEVTLNAGQFIFHDNDEDKNGTDYKTDAWLFATQVVGTYKFNKDFKATVAPGFMTYTAANLSASPGMNNETPFTSTRNLMILTAPGDFSFKIGKLKTKVYWDFAYNIDGAKRTRDVYGLDGIGTNSNHTGQDNLAWLLGVQVGDNKKKGDWSAMFNYRQTGISAVDPNLNDSDFALGQLNTQGFKTGVAYNFTDAIVGGVTYLQGWHLRGDLHGGQATGGAGVANTRAFQILQVDLNMKF